MNHDALKAALRRCKPVTLRAVLADGTTRDLAPPGGKRKRWSHTLETLDSMAWVAVELLDGQGRIQSVCENDEPAGDLEDIADVSGANQTAAMMNIMLRGQDVALKRNSEQLKQLTGAVVDLARLVVETQRAYAANLRVVQDYVVPERDRDGESGLLSDGPIADLAPLLAAKLLGVPLQVPVPGNTDAKEGGGRNES